MSVASTALRRHAEQGPDYSSSLVPVVDATVADTEIRIPRRGRRVTHTLTESQVANLLDTAVYAAESGRPLNRMITIHWENMGVAWEDVVRATGRFGQALGKCCARRGGKLVTLWTQEAGWAGAHVHMLAHVPNAALPSLLRCQRRWIERIAGRRYEKSTLRSRPIVGTVSGAIGNEAVYAANLRYAVEYIAKGVEPAAAARLRFERKAISTGAVCGKRCGTTNNVSGAARSRSKKTMPNDQAFLGSFWGRSDAAPASH